MTPNAFAWVALGGWPIVVLAAYAARQRSAPLARTTAWLMILPLMFLPSALVYKEPLVPGLDKHRVSLLSIALALQLFHRHQLAPRAPGHWFPRIVLAGLILGAIETVRTNGDAMAYGPVLIPGLAGHDVLSIAASLFIDIYLPFAIGQRVFRTERDLVDLFNVLGICALIYAPLCLIEARLSPQLHYVVYGYYPSSFAQSLRGTGFRPTVFMNHGLAVAMFLFTCFCATLALHRVRAQVQPSTTGLRAAVVGVLLLVSRGLASIVYSLGTLLLQRWVSTKSMVRVLLALGAIVVAYPVTRTSKVFPVHGLVAAFSRLSPDRAQSLEFRFQNEDALLAHAMERPVFGWGTWGRNRIFSPWGQDLSTTDGHWIMLLGVFGYVGFAGFFSLMLTPVFRYAWCFRRMPRTSQLLVGALAIMVLVLTIDLLPNALSGFLPLAYAGALFALTGIRKESTGARRRADPAPTLERPQAKPLAQ